MQPRVKLLFAAAVLTFLAVPACKSRTASVEDYKKAAIAVVLAQELTCQNYDLDKVDSLHRADAWH